MAVTLSEVTKLYVATFNRAPDAAGINYWVNSGLSIEQIAQSFFDQTETQTLYPSGTVTSSFVTSVYDNLFNRAPDTAGLNYWTQQLDNGTVSKQNFILAVVNGALDSDATILANKQSVGLDFVNKGLNDTNLARTVMQNVDATASSVTYALNQINSYTPPTTLENLIGHYKLISLVDGSSSQYTDGDLDILPNGTIDMRYMVDNLTWSPTTNSYAPGKLYANGNIIAVDSNILHLAPYYYYNSPYETEYNDVISTFDIETGSFINANFETYTIDHYIEYTLANDTLKLTLPGSTYTWELA